eukprot:TRINITY_DN34138_c0_g1_i1.p1 TRINITY_DN34138_c0_g1~~TRINITY_DN34138_c0_g1_i1.p1  ORF type:complete len:593 (+),score=166.73 TRINITY_DN34138_c0_g1_i1:74-1780(+)
MVGAASQHAQQPPCGAALPVFVAHVSPERSRSLGESDTAQRPGCLAGGEQLLYPYPVRPAPAQPPAPAPSPNCGRTQAELDEALSAAEAQLAALLSVVPRDLPDRLHRLHSRLGNPTSATADAAPAPPPEGGGAQGLLAELQQLVPRDLPARLDALEGHTNGVPVRRIEALERRLNALERHPARLPPKLHAAHRGGGGVFEVPEAEQPAAESPERRRRLEEAEQKLAELASRVAELQEVLTRTAASAVRDLAAVEARLEQLEEDSRTRLETASPVPVAVAAGAAQEQGEAFGREEGDALKREVARLADAHADLAQNVAAGEERAAALAQQLAAASDDAATHAAASSKVVREAMQEVRRELADLRKARAEGAAAGGRECRCGCAALAARVEALEGALLERYSGDQVLAAAQERIAALEDSLQQRLEALLPAPDASYGELPPRRCALEGGDGQRLDALGRSVDASLQGLSEASLAVRRLSDRVDLLEDAVRRSPGRLSAAAQALAAALEGGSPGSRRPPTAPSVSPLRRSSVACSSLAASSAPDAAAVAARVEALQRRLQRAQSGASAPF